MGNILDSIKEDMLNLKKSAEKQVIRLWVASRSKATSETRKSVMKEMANQGKQSLSNASKSYESSFSGAAKGNWVDKAKQSVTNVTNNLNSL